MTYAFFNGNSHKVVAMQKLTLRRFLLLSNSIVLNVTLKNNDEKSQLTKNIWLVLID